MFDQPEPEAGIPEYMVSYADMLTIMLAFFVVLYSTTSASGTKDKGGKSGEEARGGREPAAAAGNTGREVGSDGGLNATTDERMKKVFDSLYYRFGPDWTATNCWAGGPLSLRNGKGNASDGRSRRPARGAPDDYVLMIAPRASDNIVVGGRIYFDGLTATLNSKQVHQVQQLAAELAGKMQKIEVRGHASRRPLPADSPLGDHWDLAYTRARNVEKCLVAQGIDPQRIRIAVASYNEPLVSEPGMLKTDQDARVEVRQLNEWINASPGLKPFRTP
jgi:chemotaxis protein MotB